jgi:type IV pilus assembly protein PilA
MRTFGWIYIIAFCIDAVMSLVALLVPGAEIPSSIISTLVIILSIAVFILACIGKLPPRKIFLILSGFVLLLTCFGIVIAILLVVKSVGDPSALQQGPTADLLREHFAWVIPLQWVFVIAELLLSVYGILAYRKAKIENAAHAPVKAKKTAAIVLAIIGGGFLFIVVIGILAAIAIPQFAAYRTRSYNAAAQADLRNAAVSQEAYYVDNKTYTDSVGDLLEPAVYGLSIDQGVTVKIISADENHYSMIAFHKGGDKQYTITGPGGTIEYYPK